MTDFERRVGHFLEYSGWKNVHKVGGWVHGMSWGESSIQDALWKQLKWDFDRDGNIERAAEILEKSK